LNFQVLPPLALTAVVVYGVSSAESKACALLLRIEICAYGANENSYEVCLGTANENVHVQVRLAAFVKENRPVNEQSLTARKTKFERLLLAVQETREGD
jgi:hypothetical protein